MHLHYVLWKHSYTFLEPIVSQRFLQTVASISFCAGLRGGVVLVMGIFSLNSLKRSDVGRSS